MNNAAIISQIISFFGYLFFQIFFARHLILFDVAFCFVYIGFLLSFNPEISKISFLLIAFAFGFSTDIFYNTLGVLTAACVLLAYFRPYLIELMTEKSNRDTVIEVSIRRMGFVWYSTYAGILLFAHHFLLFVLEASAASLFFITIQKIVASFILTSIFLIIFQYLLFPVRKR